MHFMSSGTSGYRVTPQRFENFHPPPREDDDIWATLSNSRTLRFAKDDPSLRDIEHASHSSYSPRDDREEIPEVHMSDDALDLTPSAVYMGQFGQQEEAPDGRPGTFRSPSSIDCAGDGRSVVVDAEGGRVHIFARNGDCLSGFRVAGARAACFIKDAVRGESLAVVTNSGVSVCDQTGLVEKHLPIGGDVVAVAPLRYGGSVFAAAHRNRLTICDSYKPTAVLRSVSSARPMSAPIGHPGVQFTDIVGLATTATPRLYVVDSASILAVDVDTGTLLQSISPADTRLLRQPCAVDIDLVTGSIFVCDSTTQRVMQFDAGGAVQCCVADLADDGGTCVALAVGPRGPDGHQMVYVVYRRRGSGEVRMYQI